MLKKLLNALIIFLLFVCGAWCIFAVPVVLHLDKWLAYLFAAAVIILFSGTFFNRSAMIFLVIIEFTFLLHFVLLTPQQQFKNTQFMRIFAVKPEINYLPDGKFEVINLRDNRYRSVDDYEDNFIRKVYDPAAVETLDMATVYWDNMSTAAHIIFNFKFNDGKELAVSVEPRTPLNGSREPWHCMCKQQELLFVLGTPEDLLNLRIDHRGEDLYLFHIDFTPDEVRTFLNFIIRKTGKLYHEPEFYNLITRNCITALIPGLKKARPGLKSDLRMLFNGEFARLLYEEDMLIHRPGESFESLKSRSFRKGKSQGKL